MITQIFAQAAIDPAGAYGLTILGLIGAAIAGTYKGFLSASIQAQAEQVKLAVEDCNRRCEEKDRWIERLNSEIRIAERKAAIWQTRCESMGWSGDSPSSPPRSGSG